MDLGTQVQDWSTEAADAFLNQKVALNTSIKKIASREGLNREKIARVVEEANKAVWLKMFPKQADKTFEFKVATVEEILKPAPETVKVAAAPIGRIRPAPAMAKEASVSEQLTERTILGSVPQRARHYFESSVLALEVLRETADNEQRKLADAQTAFCKAAQQEVLQGGLSFEKIAEALVAYRPAHWRKIGVLLKVAAAHMNKTFKLPEGFEKKAGDAIDPGEHEIVTQISASGMPVEVINGAHKLVVTLDTLVDQTTDADKANGNLRGADDTVKFLRKELRNYTATHTHV